MEITNDTIRGYIDAYFLEKDQKLSDSDHISSIKLETLDVSNVTNMKGLFKDRRLTTENLSKWNVSNVRDMSEMFSGCTSSSFTDINLSTWDVLNVSNMEGMFRGCRYLEDIKLSTWNVSNVNNMKFMFFDCSSLTTLTLPWKVGNVETMRHMFAGCNELIHIIGISNWNVSNVTDMAYMFTNCYKFNTEPNTGNNEDILNWNVRKVTTMESMFLDCAQFNGLLFTLNWNTLQWDPWNVRMVTNMSKIFSGCTSFTQDLSDWDVIRARFREGAFENTFSTPPVFPTEADLAALVVMPKNNQNFPEQYRGAGNSRKRKKARKRTRRR
jgi:surface protein